MPDLVARTIQRLRDGGVRLDPGLSDKEMSRVEERFGFTFGPEHREFLQSALPVGKSWPDWRNGAEDGLRGRLNWPIDGVVFDVCHNDFWPASWGDRPDGKEEREGEARMRLARVPRLVPVFSHRYLTADPHFAPSPVFSVHQADVVLFGDDLLDYVAREFRVSPLHPSPDRTYVPFWSDLAQGAENRDL
ncbi:hypothetical protein [Nocardioides sp. YIM 152588]|uniref:hypothetical protein n=1 Tax=Nocardioides sp. YIM 152588 TaxID=3158259 RepID=UPI0032E41C86